MTMHLAAGETLPDYAHGIDVRPCPCARCEAVRDGRAAGPAHPGRTTAVSGKIDPRDWRSLPNVAWYAPRRPVIRDGAPSQLRRARSD